MIISFNNFQEHQEKLKNIQGYYFEKVINLKMMWWLQRFCINLDSFSAYMHFEIKRARELERMGGRVRERWSEKGRGREKMRGRQT